MFDIRYGILNYLAPVLQSIGRGQVYPTIICWAWCHFRRRAVGCAEILLLKGARTCDLRGISISSYEVAGSGMRDGFCLLVERWVVLRYKRR